jgi:hypothetical protein
MKLPIVFYTHPSLTYCLLGSSILLNRPFVEHPPPQSDVKFNSLQNNK